MVAAARTLNAGAVLLLVLLSLLVRVQNLSSPLTEDHAFRQTQTAITVWSFVSEGIRPLAYETPVFGPPWRRPIEFPTFQIVAALVVKAGVGNMDVACRLTNLLFFYLSAAVLYALCRIHIESRGAAVCILLTYVWLPFAIFWSRTAMIDYASVAFALAYLYGFSRWLERRYALDWLLATGSGILACLTKPTTLPIMTIALAWLVWQRRESWRKLLAGVIAGVVIPLLLGALWAAYTDRIRRGSPATEWLSASALSSWGVGTWPQRARWHNWALILERLKSTFLPMGFVLFPILGLWRAFRTRARGGAFVLTMVLGACATVAIFFNLYSRHNYYLMAVSPAVAIAAGFGFYWLWELVPYRAARWTVAIVALGVWQWSAQPYLAHAFSVSYDEDLIYRVGRAIADVTTPDERIIVEGHDLSSQYFYYAQRKGLLWRATAGMAMESRAKLLESDHFTTIVCLGLDSRAARLWPHQELVRQVGPVSIYKVRRD